MLKCFLHQFDKFYRKSTQKWLIRFHREFSKFSMSCFFIQMRFSSSWATSIIFPTFRWLLSFFELFARFFSPFSKLFWARWCFFGAFLNLRRLKRCALLCSRARGINSGAGCAPATASGQVARNRCIPLLGTPCLYSSCTSGSRNSWRFYVDAPKICRNGFLDAFWVYLLYYIEKIRGSNWSDLRSYFHLLAIESCDGFDWRRCLKFLNWSIFVQMSVFFFYWMRLNFRANVILTFLDYDIFEEWISIFKFRAFFLEGWVLRIKLSRIETNKHWKLYFATEFNGKTKTYCHTCNSQKPAEFAI